MSEPTMRDIHIAAKLVTDAELDPDAAEAIAFALADARMRERAQIVEYLRQASPIQQHVLIGHYANEIERGCHREDGPKT